MTVHNTNQGLVLITVKVSTRLLECRCMKSNDTVPSIYRFHGIFHVNVTTEATIMTKLQYRLLKLILNF